MRPGDIILFRDHDFTSWLARLGQESPVNHAAIVGPDGRTLIEASHNGVQRAPLPTIGVDRWLFPCPDPAKGLVAATIAAGDLGQPYDYGDYLPILARLLFKLRLRMPHHGFICSALVTIAWRAAGLPLCGDAVAYTVTPGDLFAELARIPGTTPT